MDSKDFVRLSIKMAAEGKSAALPMMPPPDPTSGGAPPGGPMGGGMPPGGPMGGGMPMPAEQGGAVSPMDPLAAMGPGPEGGGGELPPLDPAALGLGGEAPPEEGMINSPETDIDNDNKPDTMVPLKAITQHDVELIEATKGRKTAPPKESEQPAEGPLSGIGGPAASIGGPPATEPSGALGGLGSKFSKILETIESDIDEDKVSR